MAYIVEMLGEGPAWGPAGEHRFFSCTGWTWDWMLEIGRQNGWTPAGTSPPPPDGLLTGWNRHDVPFENSYEPSEWHYCKLFDAEDAQSLATALELYLSSSNGLALPKSSPAVLKDDREEKGLRIINSDERRPQLLRFVEYIRRGPFLFAWDD